MSEIDDIPNLFQPLDAPWQVWSIMGGPGQWQIFKHTGGGGGPSICCKKFIRNDTGHEVQSAEELLDYFESMGLNAEIVHEQSQAKKEIESIIIEGVDK